jgi:hypothetical protein
MARSKVNDEKAEFIFQQVFNDLRFEWIGPEFDFDSDRYKARIQAGNLKGKLFYISTNNLEDRDLSAERIRQALQAEVERELKADFEKV